MDPLVSVGDTDGDTLPDGLEVAWWKTLPGNIDSDGDLIRDDKEGPGAIGYRLVNDAGAAVPAGTPGAIKLPFDSDRDSLANALDNDSDNDGLLDTAEDADHDGIVDAGETNPYNPDTDGDGLSDGAEANIFGTNPLVQDSDGDGLLDGAEVKTTTAARTDPRVADMDGDGRNDNLGNESLLVSGANDPDGDKLPPVLDKDSDNDGILDTVEDSNTNGVVDAGETDPLNADTDGDLLWDGLEDRNRNGVVDAGETDPRNADTDGDTLTDYQERFSLTWAGIKIATNPTNVDTDGDGVNDGVEVNSWGSNPINPDTDGDGIQDGQIITIRWKDAGGVTQSIDWREDNTESEAPGFADGRPNVLDANSDWNDATAGDHDFRDRTEYAYRNLPGVLGPLNPGRPDTDGDGVNDEDEVLAGSDPLDAGNFTGSSPSYAGQDPDNDGLYNPEEVILGLNSGSIDSDADGLNDGEELDPRGVDYQHNGTPGDNNDGVTQLWPTDPKLQDTDGDTLNDKLELAGGALPITDPLRRDSDGDKVDDNKEDLLWPLGENPRVADTDGDLLLDGEEDTDFSGLVNGTETDPAKRDTDGDDFGVGFKMDDANELYRWTTNPLANADKDGDTITDANEVYNLVFTGHTDPRWADSDLDGLNDGGAVSEATSGTNPLVRDTDADYLPDGYEVNKTYPGYVSLANATDPTNPDTDDDLLKDCAELALTTDPIVADTDGDGLDDGTEAPGTGADKEALAFQTAGSYLANPKFADSDGDGIADGTETLTDADGDGAPNAMDVDSDNDWVRDGTNPGSPEDYVADSDGDGVKNALDGDSTDNDRLSDPAEWFLFDPGLAMNDADRDDDGLLDGDEYWHFFFNPYAVQRGGAGINNDAVRVRSNPSDLDTDGDGLKDGLEAGLARAQNPTQPIGPLVGGTIAGFAAYDFDAAATPFSGTSNSFVGKWDSDADALADGVEDFDQNGKDGDSAPLATAVETNPLSQDTDNDQLFDGTENRKFVTGKRSGSPVYTPASGDYSNALNVDTDTDLLPDGKEAGPDVAHGLVPNTYFTMVRVADTDADGRNDGVEDANLNGSRQASETDPNNCDTDNDQVKDGPDASPLNKLAGGAQWNITTARPITVTADVPTSGTQFFTKTWTVDVNNPNAANVDNFYVVATDFAWNADFGGYTTPAGYTHPDIPASKIQITLPGGGAPLPGVDNCFALPNGANTYTFNLNNVGPSTPPGVYKGTLYFMASALDCAGGATTCSAVAAAAATVAPYDSILVTINIQPTFDLDVLNSDSAAPAWGVGLSNPVGFYSGGAVSNEMHLKGLIGHNGLLTGVFRVSNPNDGPDTTPADGINDLNGRPVFPVPPTAKWDSDPQGNAQINRLSFEFVKTLGPVLPAGTVTFSPASYTPYGLGRGDSVVVLFNTNGLGACGIAGEIEGNVIAWHDVNADGIHQAGETVQDQFLLKIELVTPDLDIADEQGSLTGNKLDAIVNTAGALPQWTFSASNPRTGTNVDAFDGPGCEGWNTPSVYAPLTQLETPILTNVPSGTVPATGTTASFTVVKYDPVTLTYDPTKFFKVLVWSNQSGSVLSDQAQQFNMSADASTLTPGLPQGVYTPYYASGNTNNQYVLVTARGMASGRTRVNTNYPAVYTGGGIPSPEFGLFDRFQVLLTYQPSCAISVGPNPATLTLDPGQSGTITNSVTNGACNTSALTVSATPLVRTGGTEVIPTVLSIDKNTLVPAEGTTVRVTANPADCLIDGTHTSTVSVTGSTSGGSVSANFPITVVIRSKAVTTPAPGAVAFNPGTTASWNVSVTNSGTAPIKVGELSASLPTLNGTGDAIGSLSINPAPSTVSITAGSSQSFTVQATLQTDQKAGAYTGSVSWVVCNRPAVTQALTLNVNAIPSWTYNPNPVTLNCGGQVNVQITNTGNTDLSLACTSTSVPAITATPSPRSVPYRGSASLGLNVNCTGQPAGNYNGLVSCKDGASGPTTTLPTTVTVPDLPLLSLDAPAVGTGTPGGTAIVRVRVKNIGNVPLTSVNIVQARNFLPERGGKSIPFPSLPIALPFPLAIGDTATIIVSVPVEAGYFGGAYMSDITVRGASATAETTLPVTLTINLSGTTDRPVAFSNNPARYAESRQVTLAMVGPAGPTTIKIYNAMGLLVRTLADNQTLSSGSIDWDFKNDEGDLVASGVYIVISEVDGARHKDKLLFIK